MKYFNLIMQQQINQEATNPTRTSYKKYIRHIQFDWASINPPVCKQS